MSMTPSANPPLEGKQTLSKNKSQTSVFLIRSPKLAVGNIDGPATIVAKQKLHLFAMPGVGCSVVLVRASNSRDHLILAGQTDSIQDNESTAKKYIAHKCGWITDVKTPR